MPMINEEISFSENTLEFLELTRTCEKRFRIVVSACVDKRKTRRVLLENAHIKISQFVNNAIAIGEYYYDQSRDEIEDTVFDLTNVVIDKYG